MITICGADVWTSSGGITSGPLCLPSTHPNCYATLPVKLKSFASQVCYTNVCHTWVTASEKNCKNFCVEHSSDGLNFSSLAYIDTKAENGNSQSNISYTYEEKNPGTGQRYYRLKQFDKDGNSEHFHLTAIHQRMEALPAFEVQPNPSNGMVLLRLNQVYPQFQISLYDQTGHLLEQINAENTDHYQLQITQPGIYLCQIMTADFRALRRLVVE